MRFVNGWALIEHVLAGLDLAGLDVVPLSPELVAAALHVELG